MLSRNVICWGMSRDPSLPPFLNPMDVVRIIVKARLPLASYHKLWRSMGEAGLEC